MSASCEDGEVSTVVGRLEEPGQGVLVPPTVVLGECLGFARASGQPGIDRVGQEDRVRAGVVHAEPCPGVLAERCVTDERPARAAGGPDDRVLGPRSEDAAFGRRGDERLRQPGMRSQPLSEPRLMCATERRERSQVDREGDASDPVVAGERIGEFVAAERKDRPVPRVVWRSRRARNRSRSRAPVRSTARRPGCRSGCPSEPPGSRRTAVQTSAGGARCSAGR